jgi:hypothetical protein
VLLFQVCVPAVVLAGMGEQDLVSLVQTPPSTWYPLLQAVATQLP